MSTDCKQCGCSKARAVLAWLLHRLGERLVPSLRVSGRSCAACGGEPMVHMIASAAVIGWHLIIWLWSSDGG